MITYNDIYEASRKERYSDQLQKLSKSFIVDVADYLKEKREIASKEDTGISDVIVKTKKQLENATTLFNELILRRRKKILNLVLIAVETGISRQDFDNMLTLEKELFENLISCMKSSDISFNEILNGKNKEETKNELIIFKEDVEEFVDLDGQKMGPYLKDQIANIPKEIAKILIDDDKAEILER
ncbi:MAG: hypothetical protein ABH811_00530 [archaeon]